MEQLPTEILLMGFEKRIFNVFVENMKYMPIKRIHYLNSNNTHLLRNLLIKW